MRRTDNGKYINKIDNSNYTGESAILFNTYYGYYSNPFRAILSLFIKR